MIESMKPGSVIVDLAAERGGNTDLTQPDKAIDAFIEAVQHDPDTFVDVMIDAAPLQAAPPAEASAPR